MGFIYVDVDVLNPANSEMSERVRVMVDTGATLSVLPTSMLERLGIQRLSRRRFQGFGGVVTREIGAANMRYADEVAGVTVVFGDEDDPPILGVTALEVLGFAVNPTDGTLNRVDMLI